MEPRESELPISRISENFTILLLLCPARALAGPFARGLPSGGLSLDLAAQQFLMRFSPGRGGIRRALLASCRPSRGFAIRRARHPWARAHGYIIPPHPVLNRTTRAISLPTSHFPLPTSHFPLPTSHFPLPTSHFPLPQCILRRVCSALCPRTPVRRLGRALPTCSTLETEPTRKQRSAEKSRHGSYRGIDIPRSPSHFPLLTSHFPLLTSHFPLLTSHFSLLTSHFPSAFPNASAVNFARGLPSGGSSGL
jgi:hypothetical protein